MRSCAVVQIDQPTRDFIAAARVALETATRLDDNEPAKGHILNALDAAFKVLDTREPLWRRLSMPPSRCARGAGAPASPRPAPRWAVEVIGTGHAHIDVAWLWTLGTDARQSRAHLHTVHAADGAVSPNYHFTQSQPQLYDYVRQDYPRCLRRSSARGRGRWEPIGGMWVEADCNLSGPESLARQFLLGRTFFRKHFGEGADTRVLWLPDVFGYAWNLPQLIKEAGLEYFFTIKIGWSQYNRLPYDSFWWQGLDGTKVLTHFSTTPDFGSYASHLQRDGDARSKSGHMAELPAKGVAAAAAHGLWLWRRRRRPHARDAGKHSRDEQLPRSAPDAQRHGQAEFYENLEAQAGANCPPGTASCTWNCTAARTPRRAATSAPTARASSCLHDAEFLATPPALPTRNMPTRTNCSTRRGSWSASTSSTTSSPAAASARSTSSRRRSTPRLPAWLRRHWPAQRSPEHRRRQPADRQPHSCTRNDLAFFPGELPEGRVPATREGKPLAMQPTAGGVWIDAGDIPAYTVAALSLAPGRQAASAAPAGALTAPDLLENDYLRVELNAAGDITRIFDKVNGARC
jgi:alpha-mannosidase